MTDFTLTKETNGIATIIWDCEGKAMMKDRAYALLNTEMFAPRYLHLSITNTRALQIDGDLIHAAANYTLIETLVEEPSRVQQVGKYHDIFKRTQNGLLLRERKCVFDSVMIQNSCPPQNHSLSGSFA